MSHSPNPTCPYGKMGFPTKQAAIRSTASMRRDRKKPAPSFAYECKECGAWHLTTQSPQGRRRRAKAAWQAVGHRKPGLTR